MPVSLSGSGYRNGGFIKMIPAVGFNGIVATIWVGALRKKMNDRLKDGKQLGVTLRRYKKIVEPVTSFVALDNVKPFYIGHTIVGRYKIKKIARPELNRDERCLCA